MKASTWLLLLVVTAVASSGGAFSPRSVLSRRLLASSYSRRAFASTSLGVGNMMDALSSSFSKMTSSERQSEEQAEIRKEKVKNFLVAARAAGQIGTDCSPEVCEELKSMAKDLAAYSDPLPARRPLTGTHSLIHTQSAGGSNGKVGPFVGPVTQRFPNEKDFINTVKLGPVTIRLYAVREILDDKRIRVVFKETGVEIFGVEVLRKDTEGRGVWNNVFVGEFEEDGKRKLLRVLEAPTLFVIEQDLP